jgi:Ti-type conjugative transfer relaxase TraA
VEAGEKRKDAQLAREVEFAIPREMSQEQGISLAHNFVDRQFVQRGMVADLNVHWDHAPDGSPKPHAHVMLSMREVGPDGFGQKVRDWNRTELLQEWREAWSAHVNERLAELGIDARIDHRTLEAQGIDLEPQHKIGPAGMRRELRGEEAERADDHLRIARENGAKIIAEPKIALDAITRIQATFTTRDLATFVHRHSEGKEQFDQALGAVRASPELVALGEDGKGQERFTSREMIAVEQRLERAGDLLADRRGHGLLATTARGHDVIARSDGLVLGGDQQAALKHVVNGGDLALVVGYAGTGKSAMLGVARDEWERAGYTVRGAALSGIAAENLEGGSGIGSRTIASLEHAWGQGHEQLGPRDVLVVDEAGMIGTRQMERVLSAAEKAGAKVVLVGDPEQLQAIEAGAAFRSLSERHGAVEITEIRRQREDWQRDATRQLATGRTAEALHVYGARDMAHAADTRDLARAELVERWDAQRVADPGQSRIILTHTNAEVRDLNEAARARLRDAGELGPDVAVKAERGERQFAAGDRIMFLRNERGLGVKNGSLGTVAEVSAEQLAVRLDDGRAVAFDVKDYAAVDHGYAATIHKSQGVTVDQTHVLATPGMDRHAAYVALSRHRDGVQLHYGRDDFADDGKLARTLSRDRSKDMAADYAAEPDAQVRAFADKREIRLPERVREIFEKVEAKARGMFAGFRPKEQEFASPELVRESTNRPDQARAIERYARASVDISKMEAKGLPVLPHQETALARAGAQLDAIRPDGARDLASAFERDPRLAQDAAAGNSRSAARAMTEEARVRLDPEARAGRFVERWQELSRSDAGSGPVKERMIGMIEGLRHDPALAKALEHRAPELAIQLNRGRSIDKALERSIGLDRGRDYGLSL